MKEETLIKGIKYYIRFGLIYGAVRSSYWLTNLNDRTYVYHTPTIQTTIDYSLMNLVSSYIIWPVYMLSDLSVYEKNKLGIRNLTPPFPFETLYWKDKK